MFEKFYPLLRQLSEEQLNSVDLNVLSVPSKDEQKLIDDLSTRLDKYVVIYRDDYQSRKGHLCRMVKASALEQHQVREVQLAESKLSDGKILIVYEKPLVLDVDYKPASS